MTDQRTAPVPHRRPAPDRRVGPEYTEVRYQQFRPTPGQRRALAVAGGLVTPLAAPLAWLARRSDLAHRTLAEALSLVPYLPGVVLRSQFYRRALRRCGTNLLVEFGAVLVQPDVEVGDDVLIGRYTIVHPLRPGRPGAGRRALHVPQRIAPAPLHPHRRADGAPGRPAPADQRRRRLLGSARTRW
jgi:hypothetical protein